MRKLQKWSEEEVEYLFHVIEKHPGETYFIYAEMLQKKFGRPFTFDAVRKKRKRLEEASATVETTVETTVEGETVEKGYVEKHVIHNDGSRISDKLIYMSDEDSKSVDFVLKAHGFDVNEWELVKLENNIWNTNNKLRGIETLYSSRLSVKPKVNGINWDKLISVVENAPSVFIKPKYVPDVKREERYLNIPLYDMHFGISDYNHYLPTQAKVLNVLKKQYQETLFIIGSDLFHHNDHRNRTASGREIEHADMSRAWEDAAKFYEPILHEALKNSGKVTGMFIKGNHSESLEWAFTKYLEARFPQITFDTNFRERKVHMMGDIMIAATHGDKARKRLNENFATEFPIEWSQATTRELFIGHLHTEEVIDKGGILQRALSTRNKVDSWHEDNGYTASHKRFQLFEYSRNEIELIHFV